MKIDQHNWTIEKLARESHQINLNPIWQRGPAWKDARRVLLIDSILRGMDIPKIYLRKLPAGSLHHHDAVDGQQRLRAIWDFRLDAIELNYLEPLPPINGHPVAGLTYSKLHKTLRDRFDAFEVCVAEIVVSTQDEITNLFSRLQMGVSLNPAELRNAIGGPMQHVIDAIATSHEFFAESRIPDNRFKRQDYASHAFAMAAYKALQDIKAPDLKRMIVEFGPSRAVEVLELSAAIGDALNVLVDVNRLAGGRITQKWIFVDLCWLVLERQAASAVIDPKKLYSAYSHFEQRRRQFISQPEALIQGRGRKSSLDRHLYNYIDAFRVQAATAENLQIRATSLRAFCADIDGRG